MARSTPLQDYFRAAEDLRRAVGHNRSDADFAKAQGEIVYLLDTNAAEGFLKGRGVSASSRSLRSIMGLEAASLSDRLAFSYIFSGRLPGQGEAPLYISQPHWDELVNRLTILEKTVEDELAEAAKAKTINEDEMASLRALRAQPDRLIERAEKIGFKRIIDQLRRASTIVTRTRHALASNQPKLRALFYTDLWSAIADRTRADDEREWAGALRRTRTERGQSRNIDADARTLAMMQALYREHPRSIGPNAETRFILVTSDSAIVKVVDECEERLWEDQGIPNFARHPIVYHPLLNFSAMHRISNPDSGSEEELRKVFMDIENALSALFPFAGSSEDPQPNPGDRREDRWSRHWRFKDNIERWSEAAEKVAFVNAGFGMDREEASEVDEQIACLFEGNDVFAAATEAVRKTISSIQQDHARAMSIRALERLVDRLQQLGGKLHGEQRAPLRLYGIDVLEQVRGAVRHNGDLASVGAFLFAIATRRISNETLAEISEILLERWNDPGILLLAANIYLATGAWESARICSEQCYDYALARGPEGAVQLREARYCDAVALRMLLRSEVDFENARKALNENLMCRPRDRLAQLRDLIERSALTISVCIVQTIERSNFDERDQRWSQLNPLMDEKEIKRRFDDEIQELDEALKDIGDTFLGTGSDQEFVMAIAGQATVNRVGAELFRQYFDDQLSYVRADLPAVYKNAEAMLRAIDYVPGRMGKAYLAVASFELDGDGADAMRILDEAIASDGLAGGDDAEYRYLRSEVRRKLTPAAAA